ncbi:MAG: DUF4394 domain-containing protein [Gemmataceae bacterium]|nr:DUF4394 domain-containing protein [Gemmataceae bacterium]MDW8266826.1 DUF4394 domain-containing protein [Gemmataceae bacterium]
MLSSLRQWLRPSRCSTRNCGHRFRPTLETLEVRTVLSKVYGLTTSNGLFTFNAATPHLVSAPIAIQGLQSGETLEAIDVRPATGQLYGLAVQRLNGLGQLYVINPKFGQATPVGQPFAIRADATGFAFDFNPVTDRIRVADDTGSNFSLSPIDGSRVTNSNFTFAASDANAGQTPRIVSLAYSNNYLGATSTTYYGYDAARNALVRIGSVGGAPVSPTTGLVYTVGPSGVASQSFRNLGLDIRADGAAFAMIRSPSGTGFYRINLGTGAATLVGLIGTGADTTRDIAVSHSGILVFGADAGQPPTVRVVDAVSGAQKFNLQPFAASFTGGVRVASGDVNGDGIPDIITAAGAGSTPQVRVFNGLTGQQLPGLIGSFLAFNQNFAGGVFVASGDVNGDGFDDVVVGAGAGGNTHIRAFSGADGTVLRSFLAFDATFTGGVRVAVADFNRDGFADIVAAAGPGGTAQIKVFSGATNGNLLPGPLGSFLAYAPGFTGGAFVAAGDVNGDGIPDIITGAGPGAGPNTKVFNGTDGTLWTSFHAYASTYSGGVRVAVADTNGDGRLDIVTAPGANLNSRIISRDALSLAILDDFYAFHSTFAAGVFVG